MTQEKWVKTHETLSVSSEHIRKGCANVVITSERQVKAERERARERERERERSCKGKAAR